MSNMQNKEKEIMTPENYIISEETEWHKSPMIMAPDFPRNITYELMESYANYRVMLIENQKKEYIKQISGH